MTLNVLKINTLLTTETIYAKIPEGIIYLVCLLDLTDQLSTRWVVYRKDFPTNRVLPLIVDENLQGEKKGERPYFSKQMRLRICIMNV